MSPRVRALSTDFVLAALCGVCLAIAFGVFHGPSADTHSPWDSAVVYGDLEGPSGDSGLTDEADQEDGESAPDAHHVPASATPRTSHPIVPERVHALRPDRPPLLAHRG